MSAQGNISRQRDNDKNQYTYLGEDQDHRPLEDTMMYAAGRTQAGNSLADLIRGGAGYGEAAPWFTGLFARSTPPNSPSMVQAWQPGSMYANPYLPYAAAPSSPEVQALADDPSALREDERVTPRRRPAGGWRIRPELLARLEENG